MSRYVLRAQFLLPPCFPHSFPVIWPPYFCMFLVCCLSPSWECSLPKSRNLAWLAHPISTRGLRPSLALGTFYVGCPFWGQVRSPVYKSRSMRKKRYKARSWFFLGKNTAIATRKESILLKEHAPVSSQHGPGSCWGKETTLPLLPATTTKHLPFVSTWGNLYLSAALPSSLKCKVVERQREVTAGGFEKTQP